MSSRLERGTCREHNQRSVCSARFVGPGGTRSPAPRTESAPKPPPPPPPRKCSENPATAALAQNNRSCPAVTCQEWGPQGGVQGADQAALIPPEACCTAGAGRVTALGVGPVGEESACQERSKCPARRCGDPRVVSALAQAPARCPGLEPSPTHVPASGGGFRRAPPCPAVNSAFQAHAPPQWVVSCGGVSSRGEGLPDTLLSSEA